MKKILVCVLLSQVLIHAKVPDLPAYPLALQQILNESSVDAALYDLETLPYYKLISAVQENVPFVPTLAAATVTTEFLAQIYQSSSSIDDKVTQLTNATSDNTVLGIAQQFLSTIKNTSIY